MKVYFKNEDCSVNIPESNLTRHEKYTLNWYPKRDNHEVIFRLLIKYLYENNLINQEKNIIDLGAWIGDNVIPWAYRITGKVFAIDPSPENISYISKLCELNDVKNVIPIQKVISNIIEDVYAPETLIHTSFNLKGGNIKLTTTTLDNLCDENILTDIEFLHLDVEGFEQKVLDGSTKLLEEFHPLIVWENDLNSDDYRGTIEFLNSFGYKTYLINDDMIGCRRDCTNFFSIPNRMNNLSNSIESINSYFQHQKFENNKKYKNKDVLIGDF